MARQRVQTIRNFDELKAAYPDYAKASLNQLLVDLTNSGFVLAPQFYRQLQDFIAQTEAQENQPVAGLAQQQQFFPAAVNAYDYGSPPVDPNAARAAASTGGGGGGSGGGGGGGAAAMTPEEEFYWWKQQQDYENAQRAQAEADQRAYEERVAAETRAWQAEQDRIAREAALRLQRLGDLTQMVGQFAGIQARARETLAGLQGDPFKFAAAKQGLAPQGVTPMENFSGQLNQFAGQPMPTIDPNAPLSAIEQQIMGLQGQMAPQAPRIFGMAGGGQVSGGPQTVLVGEQGPEVVIGSDFKVVPLTASAAAGYDTDSLLPALAPLYAGLGLSSVPRTGVHQPGQGANFGFASDLGGNTGLLGFNPRLLRNAQTGATYYRNDAGQLQHIQSPNDFTKFGFNWKDVLNVNTNQLSGFGQMGAAMGAKPTVPIGMPDAFGPLSSPIIEPVTGAILPAPFRAAAFLNQMRLQNPQLYQLALSAYANSMTRPGDPNSRLGYTQEGVEAEVRQALPFGQEHGLIGLR